MSSTSLSRPEVFAHVASFRRSLAGKIVITLAASMFVAACAHLSVPMPFTPVPTTMQPLAVILVGMFLGPVLGFGALTLYLIEGASGLPVFTPQGPGGVAQLLGPTAGYLFSYPLAAAVAGLVARLSRRVLSSFAAGLIAGAAALVPIFGMGVFWLGTVLHLGHAAAIQLAITPFVVAEILKVCIAAAAFAVFDRSRIKA